MGLQELKLMTNKHVKELLDHFEKSQWNHIVDLKLVSKLPIITRDDLRNMKMEKGMFRTKTSGSTGEPVSIEKTYQDHIWYIATNAREIMWRNWDMKKDVAIIRYRGNDEVRNTWGFPESVEPNQGKSYMKVAGPISEIQTWLEKINPTYLQCPPSIVALLDLSKITNLIDYKGTGEAGGSMYSSEECGTIAIQCPKNPDSYHVMENQIVEVDSDGGMIITTLTNQYIRRYKHGDHIELGSCGCGRTLQTIKKIKGRVRNMFTLPNGDKKFPIIGSKEYYDKFGIKRYKAIQKSLEELELQIICEPLGDREKELISYVQDCINSPINVTITYVNDFPNYKFEEFISII
jgi:phenylacetate-CoA ligase